MKHDKIKTPTSQQTIDYVVKNLEKQNYLSIFTAGSLPEKLEPKTDLDIFVVVDGKRKNEFFNNLTEIMDKYIEQHKGTTYSLFRGPLKYKHKGLIHFIVYTEEGHNKLGKREQFKHEKATVAKSLLQSATVLKGKSLEELTKNSDLSNQRIMQDVKDQKERRLKTLQEKNYICYREWKKTGKGWEFIDTKKYASNFLRQYLFHYYEKNQNRYKEVK